MAQTTPTPAWLQSFRQASFRGVQFLIDSVDSEFGRRIVTHQYPQRDKPFSEDLGRKARHFSLTGYFVGGAYGLARDKLIEACEKPGPGELIHPYQGKLQVTCEGITVRERRTDGGYCEVSLSFVEEGENTYPNAVTNKASVVSDAVSNAQSVISKAMSLAYNIQNLPEFVRSEMKTAAETLLGPVDRLLSASNSFSQALTAFKTGLDSLISQPAALAAGFLDVIQNITTLVGANKQTSATLHEMAVSVLREVPPTTGTRARQSTAQNVMQEAVRQMAIAEHARVAVLSDYESFQEAQTTREQVAEEIDEASESAPDEVFDTMQTLRAELVQALPDPKLPEIQTVTMRQATPALVLAYKLYGDALRDADITARNHIRHPGFIPGGSSVEVVVDA